jgi:hypothetical protein
MKRAAILVLAIATLVVIVSPSAYPLAGSTHTSKSGIPAPGVIAPGPSVNPGPSALGGSGGGTGGGTDQGDADGLSGMKVKPVTQAPTYAGTAQRIAIKMMMWWRYTILIR